jgi:hypothetical protein
MNDHSIKAGVLVGEPANVFLSVLLILSAHLRLLLLGPLIAGLIGFGSAYLVPASYESRSVLRFAVASGPTSSGSSKQTSVPDYSLSADAAVAVLGSSDLLLSLLPNAPWLRHDGSRSDGLDAMRKEVYASINRRDGLMTLVSFGPTPEQARSLHLAAIERLRALTLPKGNALADLEKRRSFAVATLSEMDSVLPSISRKVGSESSIGDKTANTYGLLLEHRQFTVETIQSIEMSLRGFGDEVFVQTPSLPDEPVKPNKKLIALASAIGSFFAILAFVFARQAVRRAEERPSDLKVLQAIVMNLRGAFGLSARQ